MENRADIRCYVKPEIHAAWREAAESKDLSINQFTKEIVMWCLGKLPQGYYTWSTDDRKEWLRGK